MAAAITRPFRLTLFLLIGGLLLTGGTGRATAAENPWLSLGQELEPVLACLRGDRDSYTLRAELQATIQKQRHPITIEVVRWGNEEFDFRCLHADYAVEIRRRADQTILVLPVHQVEFVGTGPAAEQDHLDPRDLTRQLIHADSLASLWLPMLKGSPKLWPYVLAPLVNLEYQADKRVWRLEKGITLESATVDVSAAPGETWRMRLSGSDWEAAVSLGPGPSQAPEIASQPRQVPLNRAELERQLSRGVRRALAVLSPAPRLTNPVRKPARTEQGELRWVEGQRLVMLKGTPEQMGIAHARLLREEATRCLDSVLYSFGTVQTIRTGRWFRHDLEEAYTRLEPHIPADHQRELTAMAGELGWDPELIKVLNVFPELFHCSGFAVFDTATRDGVLYHGRVLDYMTTIGLQDAAVTFVVAPEGKIPFVNVGYGGFTGSVSGMNAEGISLGEMGGRGEGQWDGVPMATLMRRALEECHSLEDVMALWTNNPRTCEYYFVFAEAKGLLPAEAKGVIPAEAKGVKPAEATGTKPSTNAVADGGAPSIPRRRAVGVAATPQAIEFIQPGQGHELLGPGIVDTLALSAGQRLETLRGRILEKHGNIDEQTALWLMSRPVAMESNLHNVLFIPEQGTLLVANADHRRPAAERPYVKFDLTALLREIAAENWPRPSSAAE